MGCPEGILGIERVLIVTKKSQKNPEEPTAKPDKSAPPALLGVAWFVPGLGHLLLGKRTRAVVFFAVIAAGFVTGVLLDGEVGVPRADNPFSWLSTIACAGNGLLYLIRLIWINGLGGLFSNLPLGLEGGGDPVSAGFGYGKTFLITAGLMNLLAVLDVSDIARGAKS